MHSKVCICHVLSRDVLGWFRIFTFHDLLAMNSQRSVTCLDDVGVQSQNLIDSVSISQLVIFCFMDSFILQMMVSDNEHGSCLAILANTPSVAMVKRSYRWWSLAISCQHQELEKHMHRYISLLNKMAYSR